MPNKCQTCWNYGKSIMYCIFKCEGIGKMEEKKGCEFCNTSNRLSEENGFLVVGKELLFHYEFSEDDGDFIRMFADVNYCPMCGREL
jgi:hypothetical protein